MRGHNLGARGRSRGGRWWVLYIYIYIYIYMCVCVCVCVCLHALSPLSLSIYLSFFSLFFFFNRVMLTMVPNHICVWISTHRLLYQSMTLCSWVPWDISSRPWSWTPRRTLFSCAQFKWVGSCWWLVMINNYKGMRIYIYVCVCFTVHPLVGLWLIDVSTLVLTYPNIISSTDTWNLPIVAPRKTREIGRGWGLAAPDAFSRCVQPKQAQVYMHTIVLYRWCTYEYNFNS